MSAPDMLSGGLDDIPSFGDAEHEAGVDREHEARVRDRVAELVAERAGVEGDLLEKAYADYQRARANLAADKARRCECDNTGQHACPVHPVAGKARHIPIEADQPTSMAASSVAIEDMAKGSPKITSKTYAGCPLTYEQIDAALDAHGYAHRQAAALAMKGWELTVAQLQRLEDQ